MSAEHGWCFIRDVNGLNFKKKACGSFWTSKERIVSDFTYFVWIFPSLSMLLSTPKHDKYVLHIVAALVPTYLSCWWGWCGLTELLVNFVKFGQKVSLSSHLQGCRNTVLNDFLFNICWPTLRGILGLSLSLFLDSQAGKGKILFFC